MGIAPYKYFTFDGASSRLYDVYLTGEGVFNAPERAVNMIEIPGRNGNYALDQGKFNNITVTYKAGIVDASESNFADKMSAVRNWLCSKVGYKRLEDDYNPNEFRMAVLKSGVKVDHEDLSTGEFEITFECKPQRWLTSGETATAVANNGTLSNPTLFDSEPLLAVKGDGTIGFNGYEIEIYNSDIGDAYYDLTVVPGAYGGKIKTNLTDGRLNNNDKVKIHDLHYRASITFPLGYNIVSITSNVDTQDLYAYYYSGNDGRTFWIEAVLNNWTVRNAGGWSQIYRVIGDITYTDDENTSHTIQYIFNNSIAITSGATHTMSFNSTLITTLGYSVLPPSINITYGYVYGESTVSANPMYLDCETGECYCILNGNNIFSFNGSVDFGSDLPKLAPGTNTFTYDNTITELKVTPRWWKV